MSRSMLKGFDKYALYEESVQSPDITAQHFLRMYREISNKEARVLREDFCGTFQICCEWVKSGAEREAFGLDLDPEPLAYGKAAHLAKLKADQKRRVAVHRQDVLVATRRRADVICACNFSFQVFKERATLIRYFKACLRSLNRDGILILEQAGGPGMIEPTQERTPKYGKDRKRKFSYVWHQKKFDPITHDALYAIHFEFPNGRKLKDVFVYDWRHWTLPELRDAMLEAGFTDCCVYWETSHKGRGTGEFARTKKGSNDYSWIAYIIGIK